MVGKLSIYRRPGSVAFLDCGSALQPILPKSQCWCIDETRPTFVFQIRRPSYWRIELQPQHVTSGQTNVLALKETLDTILLFEKTYCPFQRSFTVDIPDDELSKPVERKPWTPRPRQMSGPPDITANTDADALGSANTSRNKFRAAVDLDGDLPDYVCHVAPKLGSQNRVEGSTTTDTSDHYSPDDANILPKHVRSEVERLSRSLQPRDSSLSSKTCLTSQAEEITTCIQSSLNPGFDFSACVASSGNTIPLKKSASCDSIVPTDSWRQATSQLMDNRWAETKMSSNSSPQPPTTAGLDLPDSTKSISCGPISRSTSHDSFRSTDTWHTAVGRKTSPVAMDARPISPSASLMAIQDPDLVEGALVTNQMAFPRHRGRRSSSPHTDSDSKPLDKAQTRSRRHAYYSSNRGFFIYFTSSIVRLILACLAFLVTLIGRVVTRTFYDHRNSQIFAFDRNTSDSPLSWKYSDDELSETSTDGYCYSAAKSTDSVSLCHEPNASKDR